MNSNNMKDKNFFFDHEYFSAYGNDYKRQEMYRTEKNIIEKYKNSGRILDIGCGIGAFLEEFSSKNWDKYGVDISIHAIEIARKKGIKIKDFDSSYEYPDEYFDVIILRGSLQHLPNPFEILTKCFNLLKYDGYLAILATPNSNSPYYIRFKTLPTLTPSINWLVPSDVMLKDILKRIGFNVTKINYPYLSTPYARPINDFYLFVACSLGLIKRKKFAFWRSVMDIYAIKRK